MVDKVPLFHTQNVNEQKGNQQIKNKSNSKDYERELTIESTYKKDVQRYWVKVFAVLTTLISVFSILRDILGENSLFSMLKPNGLLGIIEYLINTILFGIYIAGILVIFYCVVSFFSRMIYSVEVWSTPLSYLDSSPTKTVQTMNTMVSRNTRNYDLIIGILSGLVAFALPTILIAMYLVIP